MGVCGWGVRGEREEIKGEEKREAECVGRFQRVRRWKERGRCLKERIE